MRLFPEGTPRREQPMEPTTKTVKTSKAEPMQAKRKLPTPQRFYETVTRDPEVRELLSRLAKK